jgi:hypothetical protein
VGLAVKNATGGSQQPWLSSSPIAGNFYFAGGPKTVGIGNAPAPSQPPIEAVVRDYQFAERIGTRQAWDSFLAAHGANPVAKFYADLARAAREKVIASAALYEREKDAREKAETAGAGRAEIARNKVLAAIPPQPQQVERPRPVPVISLESLARNFLADYMRQSQGSPEEVIAFTQQNYAAELDYFGERLSNPQIVNEQRKYVATWPRRTFYVKSDMTRIACNKAQSLCDVSGFIDFHDENPATNKVSNGTASFEFRVVFSADGPKIVAENGHVVARRN